MSNFAGFFREKPDSGSGKPDTRSRNLIVLKQGIGVVTKKGRASVGKNRIPDPENRIPDPEINLFWKGILNTYIRECILNYLKSEISQNLKKDLSLLLQECWLPIYARFFRKKNRIPDPENRIPDPEIYLCLNIFGSMWVIPEIFSQIGQIIP